jgi:hypothetical protein
MDHIILTYPRSGSGYLQQLIKQKLYDPNSLDEILIPKTQFISESINKKIISIVRCPFKTMYSLVALALTFPESPKFKFESEDGIYRFPADEYIELYQYIKDNSDIIIDYEDLVFRPDEVIAYLAKEMSLEVRDVDYVNELFDTEDYLVSSTSSPLWESINYIKHLPGNFGMYKCKTEFDASLSKCILK